MGFSTAHLLNIMLSSGLLTSTVQSQLENLLSSVQDEWKRQWFNNLKVADMTLRAILEVVLLSESQVNLSETSMTFADKKTRTVSFHTQEYRLS